MTAAMVLLVCWAVGVPLGITAGLLVLRRLGRAPHRPGQLGPIADVIPLDRARRRPVATGGSAVQRGA